MKQLSRVVCCLPEYVNDKRALLAKRFVQINNKIELLTRDHYCLALKSSDTTLLANLGPIMQWYLASIKQIILERSEQIVESIDLLTPKDMLNLLADLEDNICSQITAFLEKDLRFASISEESESQIKKKVLTEKFDRNDDFLFQRTDGPIEEKTMIGPKQNNESDAHKVRRERLTCLKKAAPILEKWLELHKEDPYPSYEEKYLLCKRASLTFQQITNWFINKRIRMAKKHRKKISSTDKRCTDTT